METKTKQRVIGVIVLVALAVIFIPILFKGSDNLIRTSELSGDVPNAPAKPRVDLTLPTAQPTPSRSAPMQITTKPAKLEKVKPAKKTAVVSKSVKLVKAKPKIIKVAKPKAWTVQLGSFADQSNVNRLVKDLRAKGLPAYVKTSVINKKKIMRVFAGPEIKRAKADALLTRLQKEFKLKGIVIQYTT